MEKYYNQTLMEEHGWAVPSNFAELEELCGEIRQAGLIPGEVMKISGISSARICAQL